MVGLPPPAPGRHGRRGRSDLLSSRAWGYRCRPGGRPQERWPLSTSSSRSRSTASASARAPLPGDHRTGILQAEAVAAFLEIYLVGSSFSPLILPGGSGHRCHRLCISRVDLRSHEVPADPGGAASLPDVCQVLVAKEAQGAEGDWARHGPGRRAIRSSSAGPAAPGSQVPLIPLPSVIFCRVPASACSRPGRRCICHRIHPG